MEDKLPAQHRLQATVYGRVQGVSFRYYTRRRATELGLAGTVRNARDGTVEIVAEGQRAVLEELLAFLRVGPPAAVVTRVEVRWVAPTNAFDRFEVRY
jgi:acylphosphatase